MRKHGICLRILTMSLCCMLCFTTHAARSTEKAFTEDMGFDLAEKFRMTVNRFDSELTEEEKVICYSLIPLHLQNLYWTDEWQRFGEDLDICETVYDLRNVVNGKYIGITEAEEGRLSRGSIVQITEEIMRAANLSESYHYVFHGPLHASSPFSEGWNIFGAPITQGDIEDLLYILLTETGCVLKIDSLLFEDFEKAQKLSANDQIKMEELAMSFTKKYAPYHGNKNQPMMLSEYSFEQEMLDEPVAAVWVVYDSNGYPQSQNSLDNDDRYGDFFLIGTSTGRIHYYRAFVSATFANTAISNHGHVLIP